MKKLFCLLSLVYIFLPVSTFAQYSNASLNGPWLIATNNNANYIIFDGSGHIDQVSISSDTSSPAGTYSVSASGVITCVVNIVGGFQNVIGQMINDSSADLLDTSGANSPGAIFVSQVQDPAMLSGLWSGSIYDQGSNLSRSIQLTVNSSGVITAATGFPLIAGKIFTDKDTFASLITTSDDSCNYKVLQLWGLYNGRDSLTGYVDLGSQLGNCQTNGTVYLVRTNTGFTGINPEIGLSAYPDPFTDYIKLQWADQSTGIYARIYDICGSLVFDQAIGSGPEASLDLTSLSGGMYMLAVTDSSGHASVRHIVKY